jgi:hypothetical protein
MNNDPNKRQVPVTYRHSGETRMSEPVPVHAPRQDSDAAAPTVPEPTSAQDAPVTVEARDEQVEAQRQSNTAPLSAASGEVLKATGTGKAKVDIETLEQFIEYAYGRKGQRISLKSKVEKAIAQSPRLDDGALSRLLLLAEGDVLLAVPRLLLLVSRDIDGYPALRAALGSFVATVMQRHPAFASAGLQAALRNLPDAPSPADALAEVVTFTPAEREGKDPVKGSDLQALRQNAANLFVTWLANNRGMNPEDVSALLFQVVWLPAARELTDDAARIRALTELDKAAGVGLACMRFRQQAIEASTSQDKALREANALRLRLAETESQRSEAEAQRDALQTELDALRERTAAEMAELRRVHVVERTHLHHGQEQLGGRLVRRLDDAVETLEVGLSALRNKTPRIEVMLERAELVVDALRAEIKNLREE